MGDLVARPLHSLEGKRPVADPSSRLGIGAARNTTNFSVPMTVEDQAETVGFLESEAAPLGLPVDTITTHISTVFMAGDRAFKLKRPFCSP